MSDDSVVPFKSHLTAKKAYESGTSYQFLQEEIPLGEWSSYSLLNDPKHLAFTLSRYKFCAKMLEGRKNCLEVGPGDGIGLPLIAQVVDEIYACDWDNRLIEGNKRRLKDVKNIHHMCYDLNNEELPLANIDAAVTIDVLEHIDPESENLFMRRILKCLHENSILITGTPNIEANKWASPRSQVQHINLKSHKSLRELTAKYCTHVFSFSMNDEVVHTGYGNMAHYLFTIGAGIKRQFLL